MTFRLTFFYSIFSESIEDLKREVLSDEGMGSEPDNFEAFFSSDNTRSPQKSKFNFSAPSPFKQCLSFSGSTFDCDNTSGVSSSQSSQFEDGPSTSTAQHSFCSVTGGTFSGSTSFINLRSTSMTLRSTNVSPGACGFISSDSDYSDYSGSKRLKTISKSSRHMTLRNTPKRRSRRVSGGGGKTTYIFKWEIWNYWIANSDHVVSSFKTHKPGRLTLLRLVLFYGLS